MNFRLAHTLHNHHTEISILSSMKFELPYLSI
jgi:hypothetical protein